eukprot:7388036-Prymnesium_polylepis.2
MKGDTRVLDRIEKRARQQERASSKISKALEKKKRVPVRGTQSVRECSLPPMAFSPQSDIISHKNTAASIRRIYRKRVGKKHVFYVSEILQGFEEVAALIVAPAEQTASPAVLAETMSSSSRDHSIKFTVSEARVPLLESVGPTPIETGIHRGNRVYARKIHFEDGQFVFYLTAEDAIDGAPPWALGMDATIYKRLQKTACSMFGLRIR